MTRQRRIILDELRRLGTHPTARELHDQVRRRLPRISLGTVYRNLETLSGRGLIRRLELVCPERRYDWDTDEHYHLRCLRCGRIEDAPFGPITGLEAAVGGGSGFEVVGHHLEFTGVCPDCRGSRADGQTGPRAGGRDDASASESGGFSAR